MKPRLSDDSVLKATSKGWQQWFSVLDKFGYAKKGRKESTNQLISKFGLSKWWAYTIAIQYETARGIREQFQRCDSLFGTDVQRTVDAPVDKCWSAFTTAKGLNSWFTSKAKVDLKVGGYYSGAGGDKCRYKSISPKKRIVMTWEHPKHTVGSEMEVTISKSTKKCVVRVSHTKIANNEEREDLKKAWRGVMDDFKKYVESA